MNLLDNKLFLIIVVLLTVGGLLALATVLDTSSPPTESTYESDNPTYKSIQAEIEKMSQQPWDPTTYRRIKNSIEDYKETQQIDSKMHSELKKLLDNKYLLLLSETVKKFASNSSEMGLHQELSNEVNSFPGNKDLAPTAQLLKDYTYFRAISIEISNYGNRERFDPQLSLAYEDILNNFTTKAFLKDNPFLKKMTDDAQVALGLVRGLDRRFGQTDLKNCDCNAEFGRNTYYLDTCKKTQEENK